MGDADDNQYTLINAGLRGIPKQHYKVDVIVAVNADFNNAAFLSQCHPVLNALGEYTGTSIRILRMQTIHTGYRGLRLLVDLNWDRGLYFGLLAAGLLAGLWMSNPETGFFIPK